jgi:formylglycine-generating enzyme required for sulfatase activity
MEWAADWYDGNYYAQSTSTNPQGPANGAQPVLRGGSFGNAASELYTTSRRFKQRPDFQDVDIGFRCAR